MLRTIGDMTYLFYFNTIFNSTFFGGLLDDAITFAKNSNNSVFFAYCDGVHEMCMFNKNGSRTLCHYCASCTRKVIKQYGITAIPLEEYTNDNDEKDAKFTYRTAEELRSIDYRNVHLGLGIISNYISSTRNLAPKIDTESKKYFDAHLKQGVRQICALYRLFETINPDVVYTYNPRYEEYRAVFDICKYQGISCQVSEAVKRNGIWEKVLFDNHLPHDILMGKVRRNYCWDHYPMAEDVKIKLGKSFYTKRRGGQESGDVKIYVANQVEGNAPEFDTGKRNVAIMNSSEDEYAAVGGDWDRLKLFKTQYDGILYLLEHAEKDVHFYLRVHPNLSKISYKYHTDLYKLEDEHDNITVIPAESNMSTYTIMENCEKVICFGSTMGIESVYWGIPSILLGPSMYYYDDIAYVPNSKEDLLCMLKNELKPRGNIDMIKFGAYILDSTPLHLPINNINCDDIDKHFFGIRYNCTDYINFCISKTVTGLYVAICRTICNNKLFRRFSVPTEEQ